MAIDFKTETRIINKNPCKNIIQINAIDNQGTTFLITV